MKRFRLKHLARAALAAGLATTASLGAVMTGTPAHADPAWPTSYVGVGSDTIQDVMNALSGAAPYPGPAGTASKFYTPISATATNGSKTLSSYDAVPAGGSPSAPGCIITKPGGPAFDRPNGSTGGIQALSSAIDTNAANNVFWAQPASARCSTAAVNILNQVDFARSSKGPSVTTSSELTYIPFARDGVAYAYVRKGAAPGAVQTLTTANLTALYQSAGGSITVGTEVIKACLVQAGSGTRSFFEKAIGVTDTQAQTAATGSGCYSGTGVEENNGNSFVTVTGGAWLNSGESAVIPFSVGSYIAQSNGAATDNSASLRAAANNGGLGNPDNLGTGSCSGTICKPYDTSGTTLAANATYYNTVAATNPVGTYGRNLYVVVSTKKLGPGFAGGDLGLQDLFKGASAAICSAPAQSTVNTFGFLSLNGSVGTCGATTLTGALYDGTKWPIV